MAAPTCMAELAMPAATPPSAAGHIAKHGGEQARECDALAEAGQEHRAGQASGR